MKTNLKQTTRHCERSEAISSRLPRATALAMTNETGRSMVEMLGVLAIIGVLSITGISGYTTAMNKHKANEILDNASKRAVVAAGQIQLGNTSPTLGEFDTNTVQGVTYGNPYKLGDNQFAIPLTWDTTNTLTDDLKTTLCKSMQQYISEDGEDATAQIDTNCTRIVYNNDLSTGATSSNNTNKTASGCKTGYYGADCSSACPKAHQVANEDNDGCECANGYHEDGDTCVENDCSEYLLTTCDSTIASECNSCQKGSHVYYQIKTCADSTKEPNTAKSACETNPCSGFTATTCTTACTNNNGTAQYTYAGTTVGCKLTASSQTNDGKCDAKGTCKEPYVPTVEIDSTVESCTAANSGLYEYSPTGYMFTGDETNELVNGTRCKCHSDNPEWDGTACTTTTTSCNSNDSCASGEYCAGTCRKIVGVKKTTDGYYYSRMNLDWYSAKNWCTAQGMDLLDIVTPEEYQKENTTSIPNGFYWQKSGDYSKNTVIVNDETIHQEADGPSYALYHALCK